MDDLHFKGSISAFPAWRGCQLPVTEILLYYHSEDLTLDHKYVKTTTSIQL